MADAKLTALFALLFLSLTALPGALFLHGFAIFAHEKHPPVELYTYDGKQAWEDFAEFNNLDVVDSALLVRDHAVTIGQAHSSGSLHRGLWLAVTRPSRRGMKVLLLRRSWTVKTCAGTWGLVGEHADIGEPWGKTAARAMREELGVRERDLAALAPLSQSEYLVKVTYEDGRRDLQSTALWHAVVPVGRKLRPDHEAAELRWVRTDELRQMNFCNVEITALAKLVADLLEQRYPPARTSAAS